MEFGRVRALHAGLQRLQDVDAHRAEFADERVARVRIIDVPRVDEAALRAEQHDAIGH